MRQFSETNYYEVLGVASKATYDEIKAAYRELARTTHPDAGGDPERFGLIAEAWEVLSNQDERDYYDADRSLRMRAARPYVRFPTDAAAPVDDEEPVKDPDDGLTERQRWMKNKRRF
jgi:curved DNA-binding protein CbpA